MNKEGRESFSRRHGYAPREQEISIREDAPHELRAAILQIGRELNLRPSELRNVVCQTLRVLPDRKNWSEYPNIWGEVQYLIENCEWFRVYDIAEGLYDYLLDHTHYHAEDFQRLLNEYFRERGIGWQMIDGRIITRGPDAFEGAVEHAVETLEAGGRNTASSEIHEAIRDLSRRPDPDLTGAIHHGVAALECVARDICGDSRATLGELLKRHPEKLSLPRPLDQAIDKLWGYASEMGRHVREGRTPTYEEAELVVGVAATVATYLSKKNPRKQGSG